MVKLSYGENGRGAWSVTGVGGTLQLDRLKNVTKPGPYYMAPVNSTYMIGLQVSKDIAAGKIITIDNYAVYLGVKEIQKRLNQVLGANLTVDGIIGPRTDSWIKGLQYHLGVVQDGMLGPATASALFVPIVQSEAKKLGVDWKVPAGILKKECSFDPAAVGYEDPNDNGMGQINRIAHPEYTVEQCFDSIITIRYAINRYTKALKDWGNVRDAVASYNLGYAGTREWISKGRPDIWTPSWDNKPRNTKKYIDDIVYAF
jgi:peptidoglycan hydrolase-like protein with peptidoglycan-binding domain